MSDAISHYLPMATGVLLSPMPIIGMIVLCILGDAKTKGTLFIAGFFTGVLLLLCLCQLLAHMLASSGGGNGHLTAYINLAFAALLFYFAYNNWHNRPKSDADVHEPGWIKSLGTASAVMVFASGLFIAVLNFKNTPIIISAGLDILQDTGSLAKAIPDFIIFAIIGSIGLAIPWCLSMFGSDNVKQKLNDMRDWLYKYNNVILAVLFFYLSMTTLGKALSALG